MSSYLLTVAGLGQACTWAYHVLQVAWHYHGVYTTTDPPADLSEQGMERISDMKTWGIAAHTSAAP